MSELKPCPITPEEAIDILQNSNTMLKSHIDEISAFVNEIPMGDSPYNNLDYCNREYEAVELAIYALRRAQPANEPLTLDELRRMDGEPVWIVDAGASENSGWYLVNLKYEPFFDKPDVTWNVLMSNDGQYFTMIQVDEGLTAYRRKPERSEDDAGRI